MTPRSRYNFFIDDAHRVALRAIRTRDGIPESEQIRRAIDDWIFKKDVYDVVGQRATKRAYDLKSGAAAVRKVKGKKRG